MLSRDNLRELLGGLTLQQLELLLAMMEEPDFTTRSQLEAALARTLTSEQKQELFAALQLVIH